MKRNILIAGGTRGIGRQLVDQLQANARLTVFARSAGNLTESDDLQFHSFDFSDAKSPALPIPESLDGLVYCPGTINLRSFRSLKDDDFRQDWEVNFMGAVRLLQASYAALRKGESPSVVLFSSVAVGQGMPMHASIAAAKGAVEGLTRSLAAEWAPKIRVNCVAPALTETSLTTKFFDKPQVVENMAKKYPLNRTGTTRDISAAVQFLLSPESSWVTGQTFQIDGGMSTLRSN